MEVGATVEFRHVTKRYGGQREGPGAVNDLSLTVPPGEICVLVGPSGCGKTTTLRMVNRLVEPTSGQVLIDGQDAALAELTALRRRIGYVIQQTGLFPHKTIADNIATVPKLLGWPEQRIRARVDELLVLIGLDPAAVRRRYPAQLSGGERQRVGVARALAAEPPVMLMDEPFGAVDPIARDHLQNEFLRLHREQRTTVIFVTHDIDEAIKMGDRVAVMQQGGLLAQYAPPAELLTHPASDFVARFVGADRALKRLALSTIADIDLQTVETARDGLSLGTSGLRLLLDGARRPIGWLDNSNEAPLPAAIVSCNTTLRDTLSLLLTCAVQTAVAVDEDGALIGVAPLGVIAAVINQASGQRLAV